MDAFGLMTAKQAAAALGVTPHTVGEWARNGRLAFVRTSPAGHRRFFRSEVEQLRLRTKTISSSLDRGGRRL